jgi:hypothetical protein
MDNEDQKLLATLGDLNDAILAGTERTGASWIKVQAGSGAEAALNAMVQAAVEAEGAMVAAVAGPALTAEEQAAEDYRNAITDLLDLHGPERIHPLLAAGPQFFAVETDRAKVREAMAAHAHATWADWMTYQGEHAELIPLAGSMVETQVHVQLVRFWARRATTPFAQLAAHEQAEYYAIADEHLAILDGGTP